ncbi:hypothetical protein ABID19_006913 [Mesorhizobium robiniae]|uniref:Uncharacterized protein n=1 Tax=Mesorhizobium robiniae TaxID=559315 RepID=A0ABV2H092_9HYPH|nr:hypothetical protein [Mesorhizobium sp. ZC-5]MCV3244111.1 hypothetical protein [Mesorhizobium sp. ZC-5]
MLDESCPRRLRQLAGLLVGALKDQLKANMRRAEDAVSGIATLYEAIDTAAMTDI